MDNKLSLVLQALKEEEKQLQSVIRQYVEEGDYEMAFYQSNGLPQLRSIIYKLSTIEDPLFTARHHLTGSIQYAQQRLSGELPDDQRKFLLNYLEEAEIESERLRWLEAPAAEASPEDKVSDCFHRLLNKEIKAFAIILGQQNPVTISFTYRAKRLTMRVSSIKNAVAARWLSELTVEILEKIGFTRPGKAQHLQLQLRGTPAALEEDGKMILARVIFEAFSSYGIGKKSYIQINA